MEAARVGLTMTQKGQQQRVAWGNFLARGGVFSSGVAWIGQMCFQDGRGNLPTLGLSTWIELGS